MNHVFACLWYLIGVAGEGDEHWVWHYQILEDLVVERYMLSLHWSLTQFTPAGIEVHPRNVYERVFNVFLILIAMVGFSSFVSAITASMTRLRSLQGNELAEGFLLRRPTPQVQTEIYIYNVIKSYSHIYNIFAFIQSACDQCRLNARAPIHRSSCLSTPNTPIYTDTPIQSP